MTTEPDPLHDFWAYRDGAWPAADRHLDGRPPGQQDRPEIVLDQLGRPDITVDGRNLADLLLPVYRALAAAADGP